MAGQTDESRAETIGKIGVSYRQRLIDRMVQAVGNRASDAVKLSPEEELQRWMLPTSDAAMIAFKNGGSLADAEQANALSAQDAKQQQAALTTQLQQQGASPEDVYKALKQGGLTDDQILQGHRKYAHALGKSNSGGKPSREVAYHQTMSEKAAALRAAQQPTITTVGGEGA